MGNFQWEMISAHVKAVIESFLQLETGASNMKVMSSIHAMYSLNGLLGDLWESVCQMHECLDV